MQDGEEAGQKQDVADVTRQHKRVCWGGKRWPDKQGAQAGEFFLKEAERHCGLVRQGKLCLRKVQWMEPPGRHQGPKGWVRGWREALELFSSELRLSRATVWAVGVGKEESERILHWRERRMPSLPERLVTVVSDDLGPTGALPVWGPVQTEWDFQGETDYIQFFEVLGLGLC